MKKRASSGGQDLRSPMLGGVKMPTDDSKAFAKSLLREGQREASKMTRGAGPNIHDITPHVSSSKAGSLPKLGTANVPNEYSGDPLVQYLKKNDYQEPDDGRTMGKNWPAGARPEATNQLEDNYANHPDDNHWGPRLTMEDPRPTEHQHEHGIKEWQEKVRSLFDGRTPPRDKCHEKDHPPTVGEVDALLKKFE